MLTPPVARKLYDALSDNPMTLRQVAKAFFADDCVLAREALHALENADLIEAEPIYRNILDDAAKGARVWRVKDPK